MNEKYHRLCAEDRKVIYNMNQADFGQAEIAQAIGFSQPTISKELRRNKGKRGYRHKQTGELAKARQKKKGRAKVITGVVKEQVDARILLKHSPDPIHATISHSDIFSLRSPLFQGAPGSHLTLKETLAIIPSLMKVSDFGDQTLTLDHSSALCVSLAMAFTQNKPSKISASHSQLEVNHAFIWVPDSTLPQATSVITWTGKNNTLSSTRAWLSTSPRRRRLGSAPADLSTFVDWQGHWSTDTSSREVETILGMINQDTPASERPPSTFNTPFPTGPTRYQSAK
ncbi:helix-turn-helix domain-containing protein [Akkermansiaceae bacterium]|nr:helix-turn-helix domain-containing protein [Akkermansiaceae bacterium]MDB4300411.1 helix-turn-helix domain-containing protein [bacterium]MDA7519076.1 helix-turn-helix domain-containing protein [Akkermansiaceae bacterium]MDA7649229.1 helix-turn-helix domain-containing protein [Akkermansiaceae bacterium]MDA7862387.1 helix-turn-helix domain-containing protein [Akkermansiaceae bacterium]